MAHEEDILTISKRYRILVYTSLDTWRHPANQMKNSRASSFKFKPFVGPLKPMQKILLVITPDIQLAQLVVPQSPLKERTIHFFLMLLYSVHIISICSNIAAI